MRECSLSCSTTLACSTTCRCWIVRVMAPVRTRMKDLANFEQVDHIRQTEPDRYQRMLGWDYAYNVGYRHASGNPGPLEVVLASRIPVLADQPDHENYIKIREGNSPNHRRWGQNVLFGDGTVGWFRTRRISPNDPDLTSTTNTSLGRASMSGTRSCCRVIALLILFEHIQVWT